MIGYQPYSKYCTYPYLTLAKHGRLRTLYTNLNYYCLRKPFYRWCWHGDCHPLLRIRSIFKTLLSAEDTIPYPNLGGAFTLIYWVDHMHWRRFSTAALICNGGLFHFHCYIKDFHPILLIIGLLSITSPTTYWDTKQISTRLLNLLRYFCDRKVIILSIPSPYAMT